jgi:hypothetical protein
MEDSKIIAKFKQDITHPNSYIQYNNHKAGNTPNILMARKFIGYKSFFPPRELIMLMRKNLKLTCVQESKHAKNCKIDYKVL